jgi:hypothetical protein
MEASWVIIILLAAWSAASSYYAVKFSLIILRVQDSIEEALDVLDERYRSISKVLEIPLFFDSPQIRQVVNDIGKSRDAILLIANRFASIEQEREDAAPEAQEEV